jgi:hypothetical protein
MAEKKKGAKMAPVGEGGRFKSLVKKIEKSGKSEESAKAIAASIGRKKYGASDMAKSAAAGKKGKVRPMKKGGK